MEYTEKDIPKIPISQFMDALGEKPVKVVDDFKFYYAPYRDDTEPMLVVNDKLKRWYDNATDEMGNLRDLAKLTARGDHRNDIDGYIVKFMTENERAKEMLAMARRPNEPEILQIDIRKIRLTDFMKALGQEHPVAADGNLRIYNAPYSVKPEPTMVINIETNQWRDTKSGAYGGIYDLAYELTGSCNMSELNRYIASEMKNLEKYNGVKVEPPKTEPEQSKRRMRL